MRMPKKQSLKNALDGLAIEFADQLLRAIREWLLSQTVDQLADFYQPEPVRKAGVDC
jgi:hypothetical protein